MGDVNAADPLPLAVRAYTRRIPSEEENEGGGGIGLGPIWPNPVLVFDAETTTDESQRLLFGAYRYLRWTEDSQLRCVQEGLFHADQLAETDPEAYQKLLDKGPDDPFEEDGLRLMSRRAFVRNVFYPAAWEAEGLVVGFNLPFDLTRLALYAGEARGIFHGGFSLVLADYFDRQEGVRRENKYLPRVRCKHIDSKRSFIGFASPARSEDWDQDQSEARFYGHFLDLRTLAFALTNRGHSLRSACETFDVSERKADAPEHGTVTAEHIEYCRQDVRVTAGLLEALREQFDRHPVRLDPCRTFSPASLAKAYLEGMGVERPSTAFEVPPELLGAAMGSYYGGRAECRIRRTEVPVVYCDFLSMYPTVNALMELWELLTADRLRVEEATGDLEKLLTDLTAEDVFDPEFWPRLRVLAQVRPEDDVLPVRGEYDPATRTPNIGVNQLSAEEPLWYTGPDLVASTLLAGQPPEIERAVRLVPEGQQSNLQEIELGGELSVDPAREDFFRRVIEQRKGLDGTGYRAAERERLDAFLKVLANSGSYGIFAEVNRLDTPGGGEETLKVYGLGEPFEYQTDKPEVPGDFCLPPVAALITGAARLKLALLEHCVAERGGTYAFCDTDSMAVVASRDGGAVPCPGGDDHTASGEEAVRALRWEEVEAIVNRFEQLHPYDRDVVTGPVLEVEEENYQDDERQQLFCFAISAKRYVLYRRSANGKREIVKHSEHGLGHLLDPIEPGSGDHGWMEETWRWIVTDAKGEDASLPAWADRPAVSRLTVSSPHLRRPFDDYNEGRSYREQIKPMNFLLSAQVLPFGHPPQADPERFQLILPYEPNREQWLERDWTDKYSERSYAVTTGRPHRTDRVGLRSYRDVLEEYTTHPEPKSCAPTGQLCGRETQGLLGRRHVRPAWIEEVGKESNRLEDIRRGLIHRISEVRTSYTERTDGWWEQLRRLMKAVPRKRLAERVGVSERQISRIQNGHARPRPTTARQIVWALKQEIARARTS